MTPFRLVFSNYKFIVMAGVIFIGLLIPLLIISEFVFLTPFFIAHIPPGSEFGFSLIIIVSTLAGIVIPMNIFRIKFLRVAKKKMGGSVLGSFIGAIAGACSCGPIGFAVISVFGSVGGVASAFLTNYEIPIRLGAIALLAITYFTTVKSLKIECELNS